MMEIAIWQFVLYLVLLFVVGAVGAFFLARWLFKRELEKHPPIGEAQIRAMFQAMGRKPSEAQIRAVMKSMKKGQ